MVGRPSAIRYWLQLIATITSKLPGSMMTRYSRAYGAVSADAPNSPRSGSSCNKPTMTRIRYIGENNRQRRPEDSGALRGVLGAQRPGDHGHSAQTRQQSQSDGQQLSRKRSRQPAQRINTHGAPDNSPVHDAVHRHYDNGESRRAGHVDKQSPHRCASHRLSLRGSAWGVCLGHVFPIRVPALVCHCENLPLIPSLSRDVAISLRLNTRRQTTIATARRLPTPRIESGVAMTD